MSLWCQRQIVVHIEGPDGQREVVVPRPFARIGAHPNSEIVLAGPDVAKRALYLHATDDGIYCLNLDLADAKIGERGQWITSDEVLTIGPYRLTVSTESGPVGAPELPDAVAHGSAGIPFPLMYIRCNRLLKDRRRFRSCLTIVGRRPHCSLQLRGGKVSSFHCAFYWQDRRLWCVDLLSSNGTTLGGQPIDCREVQMGEQLEVGEFEIIYHRWSPRASMEPDWQADVAELTPQETQPPAEEPAISAEESRLPLTTADDRIARLDDERRQLQFERDELAQKVAQQTAEQAALAAKLADEQIKFEAARDEWEQERESLTGQLQEQAARERDELVQELALSRSEQQASASRLAEEQAEFQTVRKAWEQEREALARQLEEQSQQLGRLEAELTAARVEPAREHSVAIVAETPTESVVEMEQPVDVSAAVEPAEFIITESPLSQEQLLVHAVTEATSSASPQLPAVIAPIARSTRRKTDGRDLTDFVSGRLEDIEGSKRRRALLVWAAVGLAAAALSTVAFGVWTWMS